MNKLKELFIVEKNELITKMNNLDNSKKNLILISGVVVLTLFISYNVKVGGLQTRIVELEGELETQSESHAKSLSNIQANLDESKLEYESLNENTKEYQSLSDEEKDAVDANIVEVKKQTEEKLAAEKAEREAKEAEEQAKKEAKEAAEKAEKEAKEAAEEEAKRQEEAQKYNTGITWEDMARDSSGLTGSYVKFSGKIIQVMNGVGYNQYRMAVNDDYDKIILIEISSEKLSSNILEDDYITIEGMSTGNVSYTTVMGAEMSVPGISVDNFY